MKKVLMVVGIIYLIVQVVIAVNEITVYAKYSHAIIRVLVGIFICTVFLYNYIKQNHEKEK
jgi:flagellar biosynthesis protein FliQ